jgi:hypothetical protein
MRSVCEETDLVTASQLKPLKSVSEDRVSELAEGLNDLLHGDDQLAIRFERFVAALAAATGKKPSWPLATIFLALAQPHEHVIVKPRVVRTQAAALQPGLKVSAVPSAPVYERLRALVVAVGERLASAGQEARDLMDVADFMDETLSPKALEKLRGGAGGDDLAAA